MRRFYKLPGNHNENRMDKNDRYLQASPVKPPFDINGSRPALRCAASWPMCAAYRAGAARLNNHEGGIDFQDSSAGRILARRRRLISAVRVSAKVAVTSAGLAIRIRSQPEASEISNGRMASRKSRLARLRWTAVPLVLPAATPTRTCWVEVSLACATSTTSGWA